MHIQADESPTGGTWTGGALGRVHVQGLPPLTGGGFLFGRENRLTEECPENVRAFLVGIHRRNRFQFKSENDSHQKIPGRETLTVAQIGRVRVRDVNAFRKFLVSDSSHVTKYGVRLTERQRGLPA